MNKLYEKIKKHYDEVTTLTFQCGGSVKEAKKLKGALTAEIVREEIIEYLQKNKCNIKVSNVNSYIFGSKNEYDLIIAKPESNPYMGIIYNPNDVLAIVEVKARGLYNMKSDPQNIITAANRVAELNEKIKFGYITITENVPKNDINKEGKPTVKHWDITKEELTKNIKCESIIYAVTLYSGQRKGEDIIIDEGSDDEFAKFVDFLVL